MMLVYLSDNVNCRFGFSMPFDVVSWCKLRTTAKYKYKLHLYPSRAKETESPILIIYCRLFRSFTTKFLCSSFVRYSLGSNSSVDISKMDGKAILESHLGKLLGYDDGVSDMLDHLLSIESREVISQYQTPWLLENCVGIWLSDLVSLYLSPRYFIFCRTFLNICYNY